MDPLAPKKRLAKAKSEKLTKGKAKALASTDAATQDAKPKVTKTRVTKTKVDDKPKVDKPKVVKPKAAKPRQARAKKASPPSEQNSTSDSGPVAQDWCGTTCDLPSEPLSTVLASRDNATSDPQSDV
jgi:hypothetical protein